MAPKYYLVFAILIANITTITCKKNRTLVLVIDYTHSMRTEIDILKNESSIFMDILSQNTSQIEDVAIATFNDPDKSPRLAPTRNRDEIKRALDEIYTDHRIMGGRDCFTYSLTGIRKALENSGNNSYLFVFTDSIPREGCTQHLSSWLRPIWKCNESVQAQEIINVIKYAQSKDAQIFFFVAESLCSFPEITFQTYWNIAAATNGQVFMYGRKQNLKQFFHYMKAIVSEESHVIVKRDIKRITNDTTVKFSADSHTQYIRVTVSTPGNYISLDISNGPVTDYKKFSLSEYIKVLKIINPAVGEYSVTVRATGEATVVVTKASILTNQN